MDDGDLLRRFDAPVEVVPLVLGVGRPVEHGSRLAAVLGHDDLLPLVQSSAVYTLQLIPARPSPTEANRRIGKSLKSVSVAKTTAEQTS
jgi:hypothetical protein